MTSDDRCITDLGGGRKRIRVTNGYDPATGKQPVVSRNMRGGKGEDRAMRHRLNRQYGSADALLYGRMSVYEFVAEEWLPSRRLRETTLRGYLATLENHIRPAFDRIRLEDLRPMHIQRVLQAIATPGAALNVYKMLRSAMNFAVDNDIITTNPVGKVELPELEDYEADVYTLAEVLAVFDHVVGLAIEPGVLIAATCGTRASETCAVDWQDVELERFTLEGGTVLFRGSVRIDEGYHRLPGRRLTTPTKTRRSKRTVAIPGFAVRRLLEIRGDGRIGPLMIDRTGQRMTPDGFTSRWRRAMLPRANRAGRVIYAPPVRYIELKNLRHSKATILLGLGATMHEVSLSLGHVNERTTDAFYNKPGRQADYALADRLDQGAEKLRGSRAKEGSGS